MQILEEEESCWVPWERGDIFGTRDQSGWPRVSGDHGQNRWQPK